MIAGCGLCCIVLSRQARCHSCGYTRSAGGLIRSCFPAFVQEDAWNSLFPTTDPLVRETGTFHPSLSPAGICISPLKHSHHYFQVREVLKQDFISNLINPDCPQRFSRTSSREQISYTKGKDEIQQSSHKIYEEIGDCFRSAYGQYAGWWRWKINLISRAHSVVFTAELKDHQWRFKK